MTELTEEQLVRCDSEQLKRLARSLGIDVAFALRHTRPPDHVRQLAGLIVEVRAASARGAGGGTPE